MRSLVASARVARLATVRPDGGPHLVPITFAVDGDRLVTAVDHKPKSTTDLQRLANIRADPRVSVLVDAYAEDWARLWWVRLDGTAEIVEGGARRAEAVRSLVDRYTQYRAQPPTGPVIEVRVTRWTGWAADA